MLPDGSSAGAAECSLSNFSAEADFKVIGEADDGREALEVVRRLNPDVLVLDLMMPGLNGLEVARQLRKQSPKVGIVVLSMHQTVIPIDNGHLTAEPPHSLG